MRSLARTALCLVVIGSALLAGCASAPRIVRERFTQSSLCSYYEIEVTETRAIPEEDAREYTATGCGERQVYRCWQRTLYDIRCARVD
ncbi:MAG: hypothetical protein JXR83_03835 [Deltaproteobacteria bacterium]|nr:hypothetical protein [Deltaproteobacteria bacterium]